MAGLLASSKSLWIAELLLIPSAARMAELLAISLAVLNAEMSIAPYLGKRIEELSII